MSRNELIAVLLLSVCFGSLLPAQARLPAHAISQLRPFAGHWSVEQVLWRPGSRPDTTHLDAVIEFSADSSMLIVRESTADGRFQFVGYHTYDASSGRYINWGAASDQALGWAKGVADGGDLRFDGTVKFLQSGDTLAYRGHWRLVGSNQHVYEARGVHPSNPGPLLKRDVYRRKDVAR
jgi:hypothetical protein